MMRLLFCFVAMGFLLGGCDKTPEEPRGVSAETSPIDASVVQPDPLEVASAAIDSVDSQSALTDEHFKVEVVASGLADAMEIALAPDGRVFIVERTGAVKLYNPAGGETTIIKTLEVEVRNDTFARECGLLGVTLDPKFTENGWVYLFYSVKGKMLQRLARFTFAEGTLSNETLILEFPHDRENAVCHEAGSLAFGRDGCLYLSVGDNTCPFESDGFAPLDERPGRLFYDAQRTAANTRDLRGKILRIEPLPEGGYAIPVGNLFDPYAADPTAPEIYVMGCRNPYRISIDSKTGYLYWGEVGPDAGQDTERGSQGYDEINQAKAPGNFGWPYLVGDKPYTDFDFDAKKLGKTFNPAALENHSPNSTGMKVLPAVEMPFWFYPRASACAGPVYHYDSYPEIPSKLPKELDNTLIIYDWTSAWLRRIKLDEKSQIVSNEPFLSRHLFIHPGDMEMGPQGELYILEYGSAWYDGIDGALKKITWSAEPIAIDLNVKDPRMSGLDLEHPGTKLISKSTCLACHMTRQKSLGPTYQDVAKKYGTSPAARDTLAQKVLSGGMGVWGAVPMPPHPHHNIEETQQMIDAILAIKIEEHK